MVIVALFYLRAMGAWTTHTIIATVLGVVVSVLLGCGLIALAFYNDKLGHGTDVSDTTKKRQG